jgi:hypothetical protein
LIDEDDVEEEVGADIDVEDTDEEGADDDAAARELKYEDNDSVLIWNFEDDNSMIDVSSC